jgi:hypothetical protein
MRPPRARLCLGKGARCSVLLKFLRPLKVIAKAIGNPVKDQRLDDLIAVSCQVTTWGGKTFVLIFHQSATIPGLLHSAERWATVLEQGTGEVWGGSLTLPQPPLLSPQTSRTSQLRASFSMPKIRQKISPLFGRWVLRSTTTTNPPPRSSQRTMILCLGWGGGLHEGQEWGWDGIDQWATLGGAMYNGPSFADGWTPQRKTFLEIFLHLFPLKYFTNVIVEGTSNALVGVDSARTTIGEMLQYVGMWLLMSCYMKSPGYFWQSAPRTTTTLDNDDEDKENDTPLFTFNRYMSRRRFLAITSALRFTLLNLPTFRDKFWEVRDMIPAWNKHMAKIFLAAWVICLDESMSIWHNQWTCPGWVFCPRKPNTGFFGSRIKWFYPLEPF